MKAFYQIPFEIDKGYLLFDNKLEGKGLIILPERYIKEFCIFPGENIVVRCENMKLVFLVGLPDDSDFVIIGPEYERKIDDVAGDVIFLGKEDINKVDEGKNLILFLEDGNFYKDIFNIIMRRKYLNLNVLYNINGYKFVLSSRDIPEKVESFKITEVSISEVFAVNNIEGWKEKWNNYLKNIENLKRLKRKKKRMNSELISIKKMIKENYEKLKSEVSKYERIEEFISLLIWIKNKIEENYVNLPSRIEDLVMKIGNASKIEIDGYEVDRENLIKFFRHFKREKLCPKEDEKLMTFFANYLDEAKRILTRVDREFFNEHY